jgi:2-polyprenyl-3-methyl-5-hydroxy-6-metoxy-1,4-benzoquinol methylase
MLSQQSFFKQIVKITKRTKRLPFFLDFIGTEKSVIHVGCADWPIFETSNNLHIQLCNKNKNVDGYDPQEETINNMKTCPSLLGRNLFATLPEKKYDIIISPETIEHVNNVEGFLLSLVKLANVGAQFLLTGPNALCYEHYNRNTNRTNEFVEIVHPDHNCWYSPYTLPNVIRKVLKSNNINVNFTEIGVVENETMVYVIFTIT